MLNPNLVSLPFNKINHLYSVVCESISKNCIQPHSQVIFLANICNRMTDRYTKIAWPGIHCTRHYTQNLGNHIILLYYSINYLASTSGNNVSKADHCRTSSFANSFSLQPFYFGTSYPKHQKTHSCQIPLETTLHLAFLHLLALNQ